jgi:hypothetical protein
MDITSDDEEMMYRPQIRVTSPMSTTVDRMRNSISNSENGSVSSAGASAITSVSTMVTSFRSSLIVQSTAQRLSPMFVRLNRLYVMTICLVAVLILLTHVVQTFVMGEYPSITREINDAGLRRFMLKEVQFETFQVCNIEHTSVRFSDNYTLDTFTPFCATIYSEYNTLNCFAN